MKDSGGRFKVKDSKSEVKDPALSFSRQNDILPYLAMQSLKVLVVGCGGIGSNAVNVLARMGVGEITVYDDGRVERPNVAPGCFDLDDIGHMKTLSVSRKLIGSSTASYQYRFGPDDSWAGDIAIMAVDELKIRRELWESADIDCTWWIDSRMGGDRSSIYVVNRENGRGARIYERSLRKQTTDLSCGQKATAFITAGVIPGMIGSAVYNIVNGQQPPIHMQWIPSMYYHCCVTEEE
jgi:hypothetical protein